MTDGGPLWGCLSSGRVTRAPRPPLAGDFLGTFSWARSKRAALKAPQGHLIVNAQLTLLRAGWAGSKSQSRPHATEAHLHSLARSLLRAGKSPERSSSPRGFRRVIPPSPSGVGCARPAASTALRSLSRGRAANARPVATFASVSGASVLLSKSCRPPRRTAERGSSRLPLIPSIWPGSWPKHTRGAGTWPRPCPAR